MTDSATTLRAGPWPGVRTTNDPYDDEASGFLVDGQNGYIPDPSGKSGFYARPGFSAMNRRAAIFSGPCRGQAVYAHTALDGTVTNLIIMGGHVFRCDDTLSMFTDVTPVGVTIDPAITTRVKCLSIIGTLIVHDGVHRPWVASNLSSTPITGTYIQYNAANHAWVARDITQYGGSLVVIVASVNSAARSGIAWSEPGFPTVGFEQTGYSNFWPLEQTGASPLQAILGRNDALYYWRERAIGRIIGAIGPNLATTSTHDSVAYNIGTKAWQSIQSYGTTIFFTDLLGRPHAMPAGGKPIGIWQNMRAVVEQANVSAQTVTGIVTVSALEPTLNQYIVGIWSPNANDLAQPTDLAVFDGATGTYVGRWSIGGGTTGISIDAMGTLIDGAGHATLVVLGSGTPGGASGYAWSFNALLGTPSFLTTEDGRFLTTEDGRRITTEGQNNIWLDDTTVPLITGTTELLGYSDDTVLNADQIAIVSTSDAPVEVSLITTTTSGTVQGTPSPSASNDGTFRTVVGADGQGRGLQVKVRPTTAGSQWSLQSVRISAVASLAGPEDP